MKTCDNCYWRFRYDKYEFCVFHKEKQNTVCKEHDYRCDECEHEMACFEQNGFYYCTDCLLQENGVETFEIKHYTLGGEYLGNENDMQEVIDVVVENCYGINIIEEY